MPSNESIGDKKISRRQLTEPLVGGERSTTYRNRQNNPPIANTEQLDCARREAVAEAYVNMLGYGQDLYEQLLCLMEPHVYIACEVRGVPADGPYAVFGGVLNTFHAIPFETIAFNPSEGTVTIGSAGGFRYSPARAGFYHVDCYYKDTKTTPACNVWMQTNDNVEIGRIDLSSQKLWIQGSKIVYCAPPSFISVGLLHNNPTPVYFNNGAADESGSGYVSIHFVGDYRAATL